MRRVDGDVENRQVVFSATGRDVAVAATHHSACEVVTRCDALQDGYRPEGDDEIWDHLAVLEAVSELTRLADDEAATLATSSHHEAEEVRHEQPALLVV